MSTEVKTIEEWLVQKHSTLWGNWDVTDDKERVEAATWFHKEITDLLDYVDHRRVTCQGPCHQHENVLCMSTCCPNCQTNKEH